jgi:thiol:disulfide interchange protein/DsbC/DsbD-like thiol-disulfide interchange protein
MPPDSQPYNRWMKLRPLPQLNPERTHAALLAFLMMFFAAVSPLRAQMTEAGTGGPGPVKGTHLTAELVALSPQLPAGGSTTVGLTLTLEAHWHVYFVNAGDSGEPPSIHWTLPPGITAGPLQFDPPSRLPLGPLVDFGYEDQVTFPVSIAAARSLKPGMAHLDAHVTWLVCAQVCIPGRAHLGLDLNVVPPGPSAPALVGALGQAIRQLPQPVQPPVTVTARGGAHSLVLDLHTGTSIADAEFYPYPAADPAAPNLIDNAQEDDVERLPGGIRLRVTRSADLKSWPAEVHGLIKIPATGDADNQAAYEFTVPIVAGEVAPQKGTAPAGNGDDVSSITVFGFLGLAFLGGLILNLMPCVFPVLFLKGLALVNSAHQPGESAEEVAASRRVHLKHGLVYTLGIVVSFWVIVSALLLLRAGGSKLGWGFQLQSPGFVAVLAALLFFLALSLAGQFEVGLSATSAGESLTHKRGYAGSFFTGVLATVVATPCTAPLMGAAIGFALGQPPWLTFLIFTAVALGLAVPYLALTAQPGWTKFLPRPGAWMELLKQFTAVPLFATVIWLTWVYGQLYAAEGVDRTLRLLSCYLLLAIAGWALGRWPAKRGATLAAVLIAACALALPLMRSAHSALEWQPWSPAAFSAARDSGKPIFIDYTAGWCLSCKVNEAAVLDSTEVQQSLAAHHLVLLRADWTRYDADITDSLSNVGRSGVPTYVIYPAGKNSNATVLPELLSKAVVLKAIDEATKQP